MDANDPSADCLPPTRRRRWALPGWLRTLKARIALGALAALFAAISLATGHLMRAAEDELLWIAARREHAEAQRFAAIIGRRIGELQRSLRIAGQQMDRREFDDPHALARFFDRHPLLQAQFADVAAVDTEGGVRVVVDARGPRYPATTVADREYFQRTLAAAAAVISAPFAAREGDEPLVVFTHPLRDEGGTWGLLAASIRLTSRDLVEDLSEARDSDDDSLLAVTDGRGTILAHPQSALILADLAAEPRLAGPARQWRADGRPLIRDAGTWHGAGEVVAMAGEPASGWHVWRTTSTASMLAPVAAARRSALWVAAGVGLASAGLLLLYLAWQLAPLGRLERRAAALLDGHSDARWPRASGEIGSLARTLRHVSDELARSERLNSATMNKLRSVMEASPVGLAFVAGERFDLVSADCCRLLGQRQPELVGRPAGAAFADRREYRRLRRRAAAAFKRGCAYEGEFRLRTGNGREFWALLRARAVAPDDPSQGSIWSFTDIDEQVRVRGELEHAVDHDALTGLLNRKAFDQRLAAAFGDETPGRAASVVMIDLDRFKPVNDEGGHAAGDAMLKAVARAIAARVRAGDPVARIGGDEFAILLPGCERQRALTIARAVHDGVRELALEWEGRMFHVGASLGVAERLPTQRSAAEWLAAADRACYEAKRAGRNAVREALAQV